MTQRLDARLASYSSPMLSIFRIVFGLLFTLHGAQKILAWPSGMQSGPGLFDGPAVPVGTWPFWWAGLIELVLGILITIGLFTRIAAFIAAGHMAVAYFWQHLPSSFFPIENGGEPAILFCFGFLLLATTGAGAGSVDGRRRVGAAGYAGRRTGHTRGTATTAVPRRRGLAGLRDRFSR